MPLDIPLIRALCFDVDGTLSDTDDLLVEKLVHLLEPFHFLFPRRNIKHAARRIIMATEAPANFLIGIPDILGLDNTFFTLADWAARIARKKARKFLLIHGTREMLAELSQKYPLAVVSARDARTTKIFLEKFDLLPFFRCIATATTCKHTKPFPDPILWAAEQMAVPPETCLMVGDTTVDIRAGKAAGAQTVGVLCGFGERAELERLGSDAILETTPELINLLSK